MAPYELIPVMGMLIPITAVIVGAVIILDAMYRRHKSKELEHQERMLAIEKGRPLPTKPELTRPAYPFT